MPYRPTRVLPAVASAAALLGSVAFVVSGAVSAQPKVDSAKLGMYVGYNQAGRFDAMEKSLGQPLTWSVIMFGTKSVEQMRSASWGQLEGPDAYLPDLSHRINLVATVPLAFGPGGMSKTEAGRRKIAQNLRDTAAGKWDDDYRLVANRLVKTGYGDAVIRLGHEFDIAHPPFSVHGGNEDEYIGAFRHVVDVFRSVSPGFRFDWTSTRAKFREYGPSAYPGDRYVDIVGMDIYYRKSGTISDDVWEKQFLARLQEHRDFAKAHGKPVSYAEWGRALGTSARFVDLMHNWFASIDHDGPGGLAYHSYFNEKKQGYDLELLPDVKQRYLQRFRRDGSPAPTPPPTTPTTTVAPITTTVPPAAAPPTTAPPSDPPPSDPPPGGDADGVVFSVAGSRFEPSISAIRSGSFITVVAEHEQARLYNVRHRVVGANNWKWDGQTRATRTVLGNLDPDTAYDVQVKAYIAGSWRDWNTVRVDAVGIGGSGGAAEARQQSYEPTVRLSRDGAVLLVEHAHVDAKLFNVRYQQVGAERWRWLGQTRADSTLVAQTDPDTAYDVEVKAYIDGSWRDWHRFRSEP